MEIAVDFIVDDRYAGERLDQVVARQVPDFSRGAAAAMIRAGKILVGGMPRKPGYRLKHGEGISGRVAPPAPPAVVAEAVSLDVIHEDTQILVVNKPPGMVVHPAPGNWEHTLVNALLRHCPAIEGVGEDPLRPGIVHRLDKDTSGVMVVAKTSPSFDFLKQAFFHRRVQKRYLAVANGLIPSPGGIISHPIGRHPIKRKMMAIDPLNGRPALTLWQRRCHGPEATLVEADLKTGRTHQIRVHFKALGYPLVGDTCYGRRRVRQGRKKHLTPIERSAQRQMLHAWKLSFRHPWSGRPVQFTAPVAPDMAALLRQYRMMDNDG